MFVGLAGGEAPHRLCAARARGGHEACLRGVVLWKLCGDLGRPSSGTLRKGLAGTGRRGESYSSYTWVCSNRENLGRTTWKRDNRDGLLVGGLPIKIHAHTKCKNS